MTDQSSCDQLKEENEAYWTNRASGYSEVNKDELRTQQKATWTAELAAQIESAFPGAQPHELHVLDMGCGPGFFSIILARAGYRVTAADYTPAMLDEARTNARNESVEQAIDFCRMDAENLEVASDTFDIVVSRNLTWNLPHPDAAYAEWLRVLKPGGMLLNFDASYGDTVRNNEKNGTHLPEGKVYGHCGMTPELETANAKITLSMPMSKTLRPEWDTELLESLGCSDCGFDKAVGTRILGKNDLADAPMFLVWARK